jgi:hypothetical protein
MQNPLTRYRLMLRLLREANRLTGYRKMRGLLRVAFFVRLIIRMVRAESQ